MLPGMVITPVTVRPTVAFTDNVASATDLTTYTFATRAVGTASDDRVVVVGLTGRKAGAAATISTVTIGGITATPLVTANNTTGGNSSVTALYAALVPTGTTASVVITFSAGQVRAAIGIWTVKGLGGTIVPYHTASASTGSDTDPNSVSLIVPNYGARIAFYYNGSGGSQSTSWSGVTEDFDAVIETNTYSGGHSNNNGGGPSAFIISPDASGTPADPVTVACSWGY